MSQNARVIMAILNLIFVELELVAYCCCYCLHRIPCQIYRGKGHLTEVHLLYLVFLHLGPRVASIPSLLFLHFLLLILPKLAIH